LLNLRRRRTSNPFTRDVRLVFFDRLKISNGKKRLESLDPGASSRARCRPSASSLRRAPRRSPRAGARQPQHGRKLIIGEPGGRIPPYFEIPRIEKAGSRSRSAASSEGFLVKLLGNVSFNPVSALTGAPSA